MITIREALLNEVYKVGKKQFFKDHDDIKLIEVKSMMYKGNSFTTKRALRVLKSLGYETPDCPREHIIELYEKSRMNRTQIEAKSGVTSRALMNWVSGRSSPNWVTFRSVCEVLECPIVSKLPY